MAPKFAPNWSRLQLDLCSFKKWKQACLRCETSLWLEGAHASANPSCANRHRLGTHCSRYGIERAARYNFKANGEAVKVRAVKLEQGETATPIRGLHNNHSGGRNPTASRMLRSCAGQVKVTTWPIRGRLDVSKPLLSSQMLWKDYRRHETRQAETVLDFLGRMEAHPEGTHWCPLAAEGPVEGRR